MLRKNLKSFRIKYFALAFAIIFCSCATGLLSDNVMRYLLQICLYTALGEAFNLLNGFSGMTCLGQQLYVGLAGYTAAIVSETSFGGVIPCLIAGSVISVPVSFLLSFLLFRMRGMYFAIATWVAAEAFQMFFLSWKFVNQGGGKTILLSPYPSVKTICLVSLVLCAGAVGIVLLLLSSKPGMALKAIRDDSEAAAAIGVNLRRTRLFVYMLSSFLAALAGGMFFINKGMIFPESGFSVSWTVASVFICIIGGSGTITGPLAGAVLYVLLNEFLAHYPGRSGIILGTITITVIFFLPDGIVGTIKKVKRESCI